MPADVHPGHGSIHSTLAAKNWVRPGPAGETWRIRKVDAAGTYLRSGAPAYREVVTFYRDNLGHPGDVRASYLLLCRDRKGNFTCGIPSPRGNGLKLTGGTHGRRYWLSIVAECGPLACGEWGWVENTIIRNDQGMWENPLGAFGGCPTWRTNGDCWGLPGDYAFDLWGKKR